MLVARERRLAKRKSTKGYEFRKEQCLLITGPYDCVKVDGGCLAQFPCLASARAVSLS